MVNNFIRQTRIYALIKAETRRERIALVSAVVVFFTALVVYALLVLQTNTYITPARGGEYREGVVGQPAFINPVIPVTAVDRDISNIVFSSVADVADSIKRSEDGRIWNVRLKENVFWQDGERLTSDDIVFTLEVIQDPDSRSLLSQSFQGVTAERVSELEVRFVLQSPYAFFDTDHLRNLGILPKHIFGGIPVQNIRLSALGLRPIGSGPYQVESFAKSSDGTITEMVLKANKRYFDGEPYINTVILKFYKDTDEVIRAYNLGQIDGFGLSTAEPLAESGIRLRHRAYYLVSPRYYAVFINQSLAPEALRKPEVRKALSSAVDRNRIVQDVFLSQATPMFGPTTKSENPTSQFDRTLLDGLELTLAVPDEPFLVKTAAILKENWESYGARVTVNVYSLKAMQDEVLKDSNYELLLFGNITKENQDLFAFWHSSQRFFPDQNLALYENPRVDTLLEEYRTTFDQSERSRILKRISDAIAEDAPAVFLYSPRYVYIAVPRLGGFDEGMAINTSADRFRGINKWYVKTRRAFTNPLGGERS